MSRPVSSNFKDAAFPAQTGEVILPLLDITHAELTEDIHVVANDEQIVSNGTTYTPFPFQITCPSDKSDEIPQSTLVIDNVDRSIQLALKSIPGKVVNGVGILFVEIFFNQGKYGIHLLLLPGLRTRRTC